MSVLEVKNVTFSYDGVNKILNDVNLTLNDGELVCLLGVSGGGKTTLFNIIAGLLEPQQGQVLLNGEDITGQSGKVSYMLQKDYLLHWRSIRSNALLGLEIQKKLTPETIAYVDALLEQYGLGDFKESYPYQLSGGMRQRVALIRTLAIRPDILLLDEPFSALDYQTRLSVSDEIGTIIRKEGKTAILVTHDISEAISLSDRVVVLTKRPAKLKKIFPIRFSMAEHTPMQAREAPEFKDYFNAIWKELDVHVS